MTKEESTGSMPIELSPENIEQLKVLAGILSGINKGFNLSTGNGRREGDDVAKANKFSERDRNFINTLNSYFGNRMRFSPVSFDTSSKSFVKPRELEELEPEELRKELENLKNQLYQTKTNERLDAGSKDFAIKDFSFQIKRVEDFLNKSC
jgi:hypothetical protein